MKTTWLVAIAMVVGTMACGGDGDGDVPEDKGQFCAEVGDAWCSRARECFPDGAPSQTTCVNEFRQGCCVEDNSCGAETSEDISGSEWDACLDGFADLTCTEIDNGDVPTTCFELMIHERWDLPALDLDVDQVSQ